MLNLPPILRKETAKNDLHKQVKGLLIAHEPGHFSRRNKLTYKVQSQSDAAIWYVVRKQYARTLGDSPHEGQWACTCPSWVSTKTACKHIYAVLFFKQENAKRGLASQAAAQPDQQLPIALDKIRCDRCHASGDAIVKNGKRNNKGKPIQRYLCKQCGHRFIFNIGFEYAKKSPQIITACLDLYFKGVSLRKISAHIKANYDVEIDPSSVLYWIKKFALEVGSYVNAIKPPHLSGVFHVDEMMVHVRKEAVEKGHYQWLWNLMDNRTRFWISSRISQRREVADARAVFSEQKQRSDVPKVIIHDGLRSYSDAYMKEYFTRRVPRVKDVRSISVRNEGLNATLERLNGTMRDREKVMRGMHNAKSAQTTIDAFRIDYNFCRTHQKLGKTPAEAAGIHLDLCQNKIESLIRQAAAVEKEDTSLEGKIARHLGEERMKKILLREEASAVKAIPREWIEFKKWREINDMLRVHGFYWVPNGKNSCWAKQKATGVIKANATI